MPPFNHYFPKAPFDSILAFILLRLQSSNAPSLLGNISPLCLANSLQIYQTVKTFHADSHLRVTLTDFQLNLFLDSGSAMAKLYLSFTHVVLLE